VTPAPTPEPTPATTSRGRRHIRLVFALVIASLLGTFAVYTALVSDTTPLIGVAEAAAGKKAGEDVKLTGKVLSFSGDASTDAGMKITLADYADGETIAAIYRGSVPDAFKAGREIVLDGRASGGVFQAKADSLVTKCPSKYTPGDADSAQS
jgi:cytochrome c-type biogenesis protein CcmE